MSSQANQPLPEGFQLENYRILRLLSSGGFSFVYLAHDERHDRPVAIKVLHEDLGATLGPERFLAEIKTTAKLQHPHILPLLDSGAAGGLLFYVMPFVEGESLRDRLEREKQQPLFEPPQSNELPPLSLRTHRYEKPGPVR